MPQKCSDEGSEGSCRVSGLAVAVPPVSGGGGGLDVLLHHAQLLVQAQRPVLALAVAGGGDLETIAVTVTIIYHYLHPQQCHLVRGEELPAVPDVGALDAVFLLLVSALHPELRQLHLPALLLGLGVLHRDQLQHLHQPISCRSAADSWDMSCHLLRHHRQLVVHRQIFYHTDFLHVSVVLTNILKTMNNTCPRATNLHP